MLDQIACVCMLERQPPPKSLDIRIPIDSLLQCLAKSHYLARLLDSQDHAIILLWYCYFSTSRQISAFAQCLLSYCPALPCHEIALSCCIFEDGMPFSTRVSFWLFFWVENRS